MKHIHNLIIITAFTTLVHGNAPSLFPRHLIRIHDTFETYNRLAAMDIKFVSFFPDSTALAVVTPAELGLLKERQFIFDSLMTHTQEVMLYKRAQYGESMTLDPVYHTCDEVIAKFKILGKNYPKIFKYESIGKTARTGRDLWACKISDNVKKNEDEPAILFSGAIHANEIVGTEICMALIDTLLSHYQKDEKITRYVDENEIWIIPIINVDGHSMVSQSIDPRWRKNTRDINEDDTLSFGDGVDLNRNFDFNWAHGGSADSSSKYYKGPYPFSEPECRALRDLAEKEQFLLSLTYHSQGEVIFYPWDWKGRGAPNQKLLTRIAAELGGRIRTMTTDSTYLPLPAAATVGQTYSWMYGTYGTLDFIVETGRGRKIYPPDELNQIITSNIPGAYYMLDQMAGPGLTGRITDAKNGKALQARVYLPKLETEELQKRYSDQKFGRYYRKLLPGKYQVIISKQGYQTQIHDIDIKQNGWTTLNIQLQKAR